MKVRILAATLMFEDVMREEYDYDAYATTGDDADALAEAAGRICYKSFSRPNPDTATNDGYLANILDHEHESVLEHASVTFLVRDVSRALLTELTRHRHLSFSVVSQRYVDYSQTAPVIPPALDGDDYAGQVLGDGYADAVHRYELLVRHLVGKGLPSKQAREAARCVLPNAAPVDMIVTGNIRAFRDVLGKRHSEHADAEIREFASLVLGHLRDIAPNSVQDIPDEPIS